MNRTWIIFNLAVFGMGLSLLALVAFIGCFMVRRARRKRRFTVAVLTSIGVFACCVIVVTVTGGSYLRSSARTHAISCLKQLEEGTIPELAPDSPQVAQKWLESALGKDLGEVVEADVVSNMLVAYDVDVELRHSGKYRVRVRLKEGVTMLEQLLYPRFQLTAIWPPSTQVRNGRTYVPPFSESKTDSGEYREMEIR